MWVKLETTRLRIDFSKTQFSVSHDRHPIKFVNVVNVDIKKIKEINF